MNIAKLSTTVAGKKFTFVEFIERLLDARAKRTGWRAIRSIVTPDTKGADGRTLARPEPSLVSWLSSAFQLTPDQCLQALQELVAKDRRFYLVNPVDKKTGEPRTVAKTGAPAWAFGRTNSDPFAEDPIDGAATEKPVADPFAE